MKKQIRNILLIITAFFFTAFFCLLPNLQALLVDWKVQYKKLYTHIAKKKNDTNVMNVSDVSDVQNLLIWYIALAPENQGKEEKSVNLIMDAYTNQILALDVYSDHYYKDWKELADHLEDIPNGFLSYLDLKRSEKGFKKTLQENEMISEQYQKFKNAHLPYTQISGSSGVYATEDGIQTYIPVEWTGYGFMINNVYNT